jgi:3-methyl-2-oxobutanoate hydroxymethyltransferase
MRVTVSDIKDMKRKGQKIVMVTAYDWPTARLVEEAGIPVILVGDSLGMVVLGYESTVPVTIDDMVHHTKAVVRGTSRAMVVADMPFASYHGSFDTTLRNACRLLQEAGAQAVKLEGGVAVAETVRGLVRAGIPVMGHVGLGPQSVLQLGGFKVQGKSPEGARRVIHDALALEEAGAFAVVLETVPMELARAITQRLTIPTIGIGAGPHCDGQVQVIHDLLGLFPGFVPKHTRRYADVATIVREALAGYARDVETGAFPSEEHSYHSEKLTAILG